MSSINNPTNEQDLGVGQEHIPGTNTQAATEKQQAGVVEARPGIIESSNIDPLNENSNKDDGWANAKSTTGGESLTSKAADMANKAYEAVTGKDK